MKRIIKHALTFYSTFTYTFHRIGLIRSIKTMRDHTSCIILKVIIYGVMLINNFVNLSINWAILK